MLKTFGIIPNTIKLSDGKQPNGYKRSQFDDAFARYLPQAPGSSVQGSPFLPNPSKAGSFRAISEFPTRGEWGGFRNRAQSLEKQGLGEDGELLEPYVETYGDNDGVDLPDEPLKQLTSRAHRLTGDPLLDAWID